MFALDAAIGRISAEGRLGAALVVVLALAISYLLPRLAGMRSPQPDQDELPQGVRPRRQWAISGLSVTIALCLPLFLLGGNVPELRAAALLALLGGFVGLVNDVIGLPHLLQFVLALGIAGAGASLGIAITELKPPFTTHMIALGAWRLPVTIVWMLGVTYAVVLCRRLPKLTAGLVAIVACTMAIAALIVGPSRSAPAAGLLGFTLAGAAAVASRRSYPSLGSSAHWAMGFTLAAITIVGMLKNTAFLVIGVPLLALGIPLGETTYAIMYGGRLALGQRRELLHEALIRTGLSSRRTIVLFYAATAYLCAVALLLVVVVQTSFLIKFALLIFLLIGGFIFFFMAARIAATPRETGEERVDMLGVPIARIDMDGAMTRVEQYIHEHSPHMVVTSDGTSVVRAHDDVEYQEIVRRADMVTADGRGLVWMARVLGLSVKDRVSGVDMMDRLCALAAQRGYTVYLLGAQPGVAEEAARVMTTRHPGLRVAGIQHGYFTTEEEPDVVARIAAVRPDILFVAFGAPKQEKWIRHHMEAAGASVAIGVGGSFDVYAGRVERAPVWMQQAGLEWLWRVVRDPKRLPRLWALPRLVFLTLRAALTRRSQ